MKAYRITVCDLFICEELTNSHLVRTQHFPCTLASEMHAVCGGPHVLATHTHVMKVSPTQSTKVFVELRCIQTSSCAASFTRPCAPNHHIRHHTPLRKPNKNKLGRAWASGSNQPFEGSCNPGELFHSRSLRISVLATPKQRAHLLTRRRGFAHRRC